MLRGRAEGGGVDRLDGVAQRVPLPGTCCCGALRKSTANAWGEEGDGRKRKWGEAARKSVCRMCKKKAGREYFEK